MRDKLGISERRACRVLGQHRSTQRHIPHGREDEARLVQKAYWRDYGTTLNGLMANHAVDMREFLDFVHDVDPTVITPHPELAARIEALPGKRLVYTNGSLGHAENILGHMGLTHLFDDIFDVEASCSI